MYSKRKYPVLSINTVSGIYYIYDPYIRSSSWSRMPKVIVPSGWSEWYEHGDKLQ